MVAMYIDAGTRWRKSSYSGGQSGSCVELKRSVAAVLVRDTKNRRGGVLPFGAAPFDAFLKAVKDGSLA